MLSELLVVGIYKIPNEYLLIIFILYNCVLNNIKKRKHTRKLIEDRQTRNEKKRHIIDIPLFTNKSLAKRARLKG